MTKKVLLISPSYNYPVKREMYPSGALLLLGTLARKQGHTVRLIQMVTDSLSAKDIVAIINREEYEAVGITANTFQVRMATELVRSICTQTRATVVLGGPHVSSVGIEEARESFPLANQIVIGEGEHTFLSMLNGSPIQKPENLDFIPPPDLSLVNLSRFHGAYPMGQTPAMFIMASRGCPNRCTFCNRSVFGNKVRYRSIDNVMAELESFAAAGIKEVFIQDDTFNLNRTWCEKILLSIIGSGLNTKMRFRTPFRADRRLVSTDLLRLAKEAGVWLIFYGVESGNQGILDRAHKRLQLRDIERAIRLTKQVGIKTETSFIVGLPGETEQSAYDSLHFYRELNPFWSGCGTAIPFPGTELHREVQEQIVNIPYAGYTPGMAYFRTDALDKAEIIRLKSMLENAMRKGKMQQLLAHPVLAHRTIRDMV